MKMSQSEGGNSRVVPDKPVTSQTKDSSTSTVQASFPFSFTWENLNQAHSFALLANEAYSYSQPPLEGKKKFAAIIKLCFNLGEFFRRWNTPESAKSLAEIQL